MCSLWLFFFLYFNYNIFNLYAYKWVVVIWLYPECYFRLLHKRPMIMMMAKMIMLLMMMIIVIVVIHLESLSKRFFLRPKLHHKGRWSPTQKRVKSMLLLLSYHHGIVDVVVTKKKRVFLLNQYMIRQVYDSSSSTMGDTYMQCCSKQRKKNPHSSQRGISPLCLRGFVSVQARAHMCYYPLSSWASITTSSWIMQRYKIKEHPCACWRINGLINDVRGDAKPKGLL